MLSESSNNWKDDYRVRDFGGSILTVRRDLIFAPQTAAGKTGYVVEDLLNSKFYRLGLAEYHFVSLLDGKITVREAIGKTAQARPSDALTEREAGMLCQWLIESELAQTRQSQSADRLQQAAATASRRQNLARLNPIFIRLPLFRPDGLVTALFPWTAWLFSLPMLVASGLLGVLAVYHLAARWDQFLVSSQNIFTAHGYIGLMLSWIFLKVVHELAHGVACKKYGGYVREAGVVLLLFLPIAYVDVSSTWRFRTRWPRIVTAAAGMYIELILAALAALLWSYTSSETLGQLCTNFVLMASLTTVLFNANPLMRFDGYYMLADMLEIPNLYGSGQQYLRHLARRCFLGSPGMLPPWPRRNARIIRVYGFASFVWRIVVCVALLAGAAALLHGAGIVIAVVSAVLWVGVPAIRFVRHMACDDAIGWPERRRLLLTSIGGTAAAALLLCVLPWPFARQAPAFVEYAPLTVVRAGSTGTIREVRVEAGQFVEEGAILAVLENEELQIELRDVDLAIERSQLKSLGYRNRQEMAAYQAERKQLESLFKHRAEKQAQVEHLVVRAPAAGQVLGRGLDALVGTYIKEGGEIAAIGNERSKEVRVSVAQEDVDVFHGSLGATVFVRVPGKTAFASKLARIVPRASTRAPHASLCATNGGQLAVKKKEPQDGQTAAPEEMVELLVPRFQATVALDAQQSGQLYSGQRATVRLVKSHESIGQHLYRVVADWLDRKFRKTA